MPAIRGRHSIPSKGKESNRPEPSKSKPQPGPATRGRIHSETLDPIRFFLQCLRPGLGLAWPLRINDLTTRSHSIRPYLYLFHCRQLVALLGILSSHIARPHRIAFASYILYNTINLSSFNFSYQFVAHRRIVQSVCRQSPLRIDSLTLKYPPPWLGDRLEEVSIRDTRIIATTSCSTSTMTNPFTAAANAPTLMTTT